MTEVGRATVGYPGGLAARYRWGGSGSADEVFALSESGGDLTDHAPLAGRRPPARRLPAPPAGIAHVDQEVDYRITTLAPDFESFIRGLAHEDAFEV